MNKKYNLALFTLVLVTFCSSFTAPNVFAQKTDAPKSEQPTGQQCSGEKFVMPSSIAVGGEAFTTFIKVMSLPSGARQKAFSDLPNEGKANVVKVQLALNFITRSNLTKEQKDLILETISLISADTYDQTNPEKAAKTAGQVFELENKALGIFPRNEAHQIFGDMNGDKKIVLELLQKYEDLLKHGMIARKKLAKQMPVNDRVNIWKVQLAYHLATGKFSKVQNEFILEMLASLSPETFAPRENLSKEEESKFAEMLLSKIFAVFTKAEGYAIFMTIGIQKYVKDAPVDTNDLAPPICNCLVSCSASDQTCGGPNGCMSSADGCGPWEILGCHYLCVKR